MIFEKKLLYLPSNIQNQNLHEFFSANYSFSSQVYESQRARLIVEEILASIYIQ